MHTAQAAKAIVGTLALLACAHATSSVATRPPRRDAGYGKLPLSFELNLGQARGEADFLVRGGGHIVYLAPGAVTIRSGRGAVRMTLLGANGEASAQGIDPLPGKSHYFIGNDPGKWRRGVPHYAKVRIADVYPGIDLVYYGTHRQLEYDFIVHPGASFDRIRLDIQGTEGVQLSGDGNLVLRTHTGTLVMRKPLLYQEAVDGRREVAGRYRLDPDSKTIARFEVGDYDREQPLVIDPVLVYSTFLGGSEGEAANAIGVDTDGNMVVCGITPSDDFPVANAIYPDLSGSFDAFISKISADGTTLLYSTFLGGGGSFDQCYGLAIDPEGNAYVTGDVNSSDFPTVNAVQPIYGGATDGFVSKLSSDGSSLIYSTYFGGTKADKFFEVALDTIGNAYLAGYTLSSDFPTLNPFQPAYGGGFNDAVVVKIDASGSTLVYSTYLGGLGSEKCRGIAVDSAGAAYVSGDVTSTDFPTKNPLQPVRASSIDSFVTKFSPDGASLVYSTYLGGTGRDDSRGTHLITVDAAGNAYVTGATYSADFPLVNPLQANLVDQVDAFVAKLDPSGSSLLFSTYLGGNDYDDGYDIAVDAAGNMYVSGQTESADFPTVDAPQATYGGGVGDAFVTMIRADGSEIVYSTFLGGGPEGTEDRGNSLALDQAGNVYVAGQTFSADFPTLNPLQPAFAGLQDGFVTKISSVLAPVGVATMRWFDGSSIEWSAVPGAANYLVYRGVGADLPKLLDASLDSCLRLSTPDLLSGASITEVPSPGSFYWYLVRAENENGLGSAGNATAGPRILDSSGGCP